MHEVPTRSYYCCYPDLNYYTVDWVRLVYKRWEGELREICELPSQAEGLANDQGSLK
jgi:hypothetical protein